MILFDPRGRFLLSVGLGLWLLGTAEVCPGAELRTDSHAAAYSYDVSPAEGSWLQNTVTTVTQTRDGYLWLGTYNGLTRFDGVRYTLFDSQHTRGLQNSRVTSLFEDASGVLWIGHETGELTRFSEGVFSAFPLARTWPGGAIEGMNADENGDLWLMNDIGILFRVRDGQLAQAPCGSGPSRKARLARANNGKLWIVCNGSAGTLEAGKMEPFGFDAPNIEDYYQHAAPARDGAMWVVSNGRIRKWGEGRWVTDLGECPSGSSAVTTVLETQAGAVLIGTLDQGLYLVVPGTQPLHFSRTNGLSHDWVRSMCEDHEGNLWIGTGGGLDTLRARKVRMLTPPDAWEGRAVLSFTVRPDGTAWIGTEGAGLYHFQRDGWTTYREASGIANMFVWSVLETRRGELYVGTWGGGLFLKHEERFESSGELGNITAPVIALFEGTGGELWIGTPAGVYRYEGGKITWSAGKEKLALPDIRAIAEAPDGTMWFGMSGGGLATLKDGVLKQIRKQDGLPSEFVVSLDLDTDGTTWIGTSDNGLVRLKQGKFATINQDRGLPDNTISHIVDDGSGNLWLGSHHGIFRVSKVELNRCADDPAHAVRYLNYGKAEGLTVLTCSGGKPGACKTPQGLLWFPMTRGLAVIDPVNVSTNNAKPPVLIEELIVDGRPVPDGIPQKGASPAVLQIPAGKQRFEIRYTALSFCAPEKVRFRHKLEGLEQEWHEGGADRSAPYSYLPPGSYTFRVIACNNDEVWNDVGASLSFEVLPQVWQTWWFRIGAVLGGAAAVIAIVLAVVRGRVRRKLERLERQQAVERERSRIARDIHDDLGASLTRITLLSQTARSELAASPQAAADVDHIYTTARELTRAMDEIVWAVNPQHDTLDSLVTYLGRFAQHFLSASGLRCRLDVPLHLPPLALTAEIRHNVFLALKEALNNVLKHATASEVRISMEMKPPGFLLVIADNGRGFDWNGGLDHVVRRGDSARSASGNGLLNMHKRLEEVGGRCEWDTAPGHGTRVTLVVAVKT